MSELTQEQISNLKQMLDDRAQALQGEMHEEVRDRDSFGDVASELADPGDASFADLTVDLQNAALTRDITEMRAIEAALRRMEDKTYGDCIDCDAAIPYERLEAQPTAERCMPCQEMYEKTHANAAGGAASKGATL